MVVDGRSLILELRGGYALVCASIVIWFVRFIAGLGFWS